MKLLLSRSLFATFLVVVGFVSAYTQTTVTLPTIPCSNCNGPGAFATSAPACTSGLLGAPLTMSWGVSTGATSYTVMIATDANLSQNVATFTTTSTSLIVKAVGLAPSQTYYWTVFANSSSGSTKATGSVCTFSTNTTWTGSGLTSGFPNGGPGDIMVNNAGLGYFTCQKGNGTCASGDNLVCNPTFLTASSSNSFTPFWNSTPGSYGVGAATIPASYGLNLADAGISTPSTGTATGGQLAAGMWEQLMIRNTGSAPVTYRLSFNALGSGAVIAGFLVNEGAFAPSYASPAFTINTLPAGTGNGSLSQVSTTTTTTWAAYTVNLALPAGKTTSALYFYTTSYTTAYTRPIITDLVLCSL